MPYPPAPPPEDSGNSPAWNSAADLLRALSEQPKSQREARFHQVFQLLQPWIDSATESLCRRHSLLLDLPATSFALVQGLAEASATTLANSANSEVIFQIALESLALKFVTDEAAAWKNEIEASDAGSWKQFRVQLNSMPRNERSTILAALPPITLAQNRDAPPAIPTAEWSSLWAAATQGIDVTALPLEWQRYLEAPPTAVYEKSYEGPTIWIPSKNSDFEQELGKELFKASVWTAKETEDKLELFVPKWVGDPQRRTSVESLRALMLQNGGLPQDSNLQELIQSLLSESTPAEELPSVTKLLEVSGNLGFSKFLIGVHHGGYLVETGDFAGAELAVARAINCSQSRKNLSNALSNLAALRLLEGRPDKAHSLTLEALRLHPWSRLALTNLALIRKSLSTPFNCTGESHA